MMFDVLLVFYMDKFVIGLVGVGVVDICFFIGENICKFVGVLDKLVDEIVVLVFNCLWYE